MKPTIHFLPGFACPADTWLPCVENLQDRSNTRLVSWPTDLTPQFHSVRQFSDWLRLQVDATSSDMLVGHSLGGLVALDYARRSAETGHRVVLVESFLTRPSPFFQNLLMPNAAPALADRLTGMLQAEKPHYSEALREYLASADMIDEALEAGAPIHAIYGDRGCGDKEKVIAELNWPAQLRRRISIHVVENCCHFPMLESPIETARILRSIVSEH